MRILVVEDDRRMARVLQQGLSEAGHLASIVSDGPAALEAADSGEFDAVVLDVMLPGLDGFEVARRLRTRGTHTPILFLTARDAVPDVVKGLDAGGDDYLTKPFAFDVLLARLRALGRRGAETARPTLAVEDLVLDPATRDVRRGHARIDLTKTEFALLEALMRHPGRVVAREALLRMVWGNERDVEANTLEAFVSLLRQKVDGRNPAVRLIHTVRGVGYCIRCSPPEDGR